MSGSTILEGRRGRYRMVVAFTIYTISAYYH